MTETRTGDVEPRTAAGRVLVDRARRGLPLMPISPRVAAIEEEARRLALAEGLDVEAALGRVREWVRTRATTRWTPGFGSDYRRGYDAALAEVGSLIGEHQEP